MRSSVADAVRQAQEEDLLRMTPEERMHLARRAGERALSLYMAANGVDRDEAMRAIETAANAGRRTRDDESR